MRIIREVQFKCSDVYGIGHSSDVINLCLLIIIDDDIIGINYGAIPLLSTESHMHFLG